MDARCNASSVRTGVGKGSRARARTGGASSMKGSPRFPVPLEFPEQAPETGYGSAGRNAVGGQGLRCDPAPAYRLGQLCVGDQRTSASARRDQLGHNTVAISEQYGLATGGQADVFAQPVLEDL